MQDHRTGRWYCSHLTGPRADLRVSEIPWQEVSPLPRDCLCSETSGTVTLAALSSRIVEVKFNAYEMSIDQDFRDFYFEGRYEFTSDGCETDWDSRRLKGRLNGGDGEAIIRDKTCLPLIQPFLLEPVTDNGYLVLKLKGFWMPTILNSVPPCLSDYRITVYSPSNPGNSRDLCPFGHEVVAFSDGWDLAPFSIIDSVRSLIIEIRLPKTPSTEIFEYKLSWMEVYPMADCPFKCPEIQACIPPELWCDGTKHCPAGSDEKPTECSLYRYPVSLLHVGTIAAVVTLLLSLIVGLGACARRKNNEKKYLQRHLETNAPYGQSLPTVPHHHHHHSHSHQAMPHHMGPMYLNTLSKEDLC